MFAFSFLRLTADIAIRTCVVAVPLGFAHGCPGEGGLVLGGRRVLLLLGDFRSGLVSLAFFSGWHSWLHVFVVVWVLGWWRFTVFLFGGRMAIFAFFTGPHIVDGRLLLLSVLDVVVFLRYRSWRFVGKIEFEYGKKRGHE